MDALRERRQRRRRALPAHHRDRRRLLLRVGLLAVVLAGGLLQLLRKRQPILLQAARRRPLLPLRRRQLLLLLGVRRACAVHGRVALACRAVGETWRHLVLLLLLGLLQVARRPLSLAGRCTVGLAARRRSGAVRALAGSCWLRRRLLRVMRWQRRLRVDNFQRRVVGKCEVSGRIERAAVRWRRVVEADDAMQGAEVGCNGHYRRRWPEGDQVGERLCQFLRYGD